MNDFHITLISDPTEEFPDNTNNRFKVRLPTLIDLPGVPGKLVYGPCPFQTRVKVAASSPPIRIHDRSRFLLPSLNVTKAVLTIGTSS